MSLDVARGEIHALVGGNGSGKSTLIKLLAGVVAADAGEFEIAGISHELRSHTAARARELNLHFVHQNSSTFPELTVAENLSLGRGFETGFAGRVRWSAVRRRAAKVMARFEIAASPDDELGNLSSATQMMVAIARALQDQENAQDAVLVLDEPTASLPTHEVELLLSALRRYASHGETILYVTHRLEEVRQAADRGTVLRDGRVVATFIPTNTSHDELVTMIMGQPIEQAVPRARERGRESAVLLRATGLGSGDLDLELHANEILGIAGILGSGRSTVLRQLFGALPVRDGTFQMGDRTRPFQSTRDAMRAGIAYVPEDRPKDAMFPDLSIAENLSIATLPTHTRLGGMISRRSERAVARESIGSLRVVAASESAPLASLSGGNQQKVILARWLHRTPRVLLLDEPTVGVDVGARSDIHAVIRRAVDAGAGAILVSSDFEELAAACDRVIVLQDRRQVAEITGSDIDEATINSLVYPKEAA